MQFALLPSPGQWSAARRMRWFISISQSLLAAYALVQVVCFASLVVNHAGFPLNLEPMETALLAHVQRLQQGLPLYPPPSSDFVALAYNPLYYYICWPLALILKPSLLAMRLTTVVGTAGIAGVIFATLHQRTTSVWWGWMGVGLFLASYGMTDGYLDSAHADTWMLWAILLGCYGLDSNRQGRWRLLSTLAFVIAFWLKQQGGLFLAGGLVYITWRWGMRRSLPCWLLALALGPLAYWGLPYLLPDRWLGPAFHYFTWDVPRTWPEIHRYAPYRLLSVSLRGYGPLALFALGNAGITLLRSRNYANVWVFLFPVVLLSTLLGALDPTSLKNIFLPLGAWFILVGLLGLRQWSHRWGLQRRWQLRVGVLALSFTLLAYNPSTFWVPETAGPAYDDFVAQLEQLQAPVFAPWLTPLPDQRYTFQPAVHAGALSDLVRGARRGDTTPHQKILLRSLLTSEQPTYILQMSPTPNLADDDLLGFLSDRYELVSDWGDRFRALSSQSHGTPGMWPRYLFRSRS